MILFSERDFALVDNISASYNFLVINVRDTCESLLAKLDMFFQFFGAILRWAKHSKN